MQEYSIAVTRTARYCQLGELSTTTENIWFVCHGYGQLAKYFIRNFDSLVDDKTVVIAPEALSRFYLEGFSGRIGASWMTTEERLVEVEDYIAYLDALYQKLSEQLDLTAKKITVLGFSQGAATASRWVAIGAVRPERLVLWSGTPAEELFSQKSLQRLSNLKLILAYGAKDKFVHPAKLREVKDLLDRNHIQYELITFDGGHNLDKEILLKLKI